MSAMKRLFQIMADKKASDIFLSVGAPINIKINGVAVPVNQAIMTAQTVQQLLYEVLTERQIKEYEEEMELNTAFSHGRRRRLPHQRLPPEGLARGGGALHPRQHPAARHARPARGAEGSDHAEARPDPGGRRHRLGQVDLALGDARLQERAQVRPHPDARGPGRIHLPEQEVDRQPARGRHRHQGVRDRAEERAAPGAGLHPDRRDPRQADDGGGARLLAVGPPGPRHAAREQQLPRDEPHHQLLPAGEPAEPAARPVGGAAGGDLAAPGAHQDRRSAWRRSRCCSTRATSPS